VSRPCCDAIGDGAPVRLVATQRGSIEPVSELEQLAKEVHEPGYLDALERQPIASLRAMRARCDEIERALSYVRRLAQGRLELLQAMRKRIERGDWPDAVVAGVVEQLPEILGSGPPRPPGPGRPAIGTLPAAGVRLAAELDRIAAPEDLVGAAELPPARLAAMESELAAYEHRVSAERRYLHEVLDRIERELVRRYQRGEVRPETVLGS
jgi:hypothetical protein